MRHRVVLLFVLQAAFLAVLAFVLLARGFPLGVRGEWEWQRLRVAPLDIDLITAGASLAAYIAFVAVGMSRLRRKAKTLEGPWLAGLLIASVGVQALIQTGAPAGYGLTKWVTLGVSGSNGYFDVAKTRMRDPWSFWTAYPGWIREQDALHIGTHPPGLFLAARSVLGLFEARPDLARETARSLPATIDRGFRTILPDASRTERAAFAVMGCLTLVACAATVLPLYALARASFPPPVAWATASLWPVVPAALLFQPTADTAYPLLATSAVTCAAWAIRCDGWRSLALAWSAGIVLGVGMVFSLVFLPVGLIVGLMFCGAGRRVRLLGATGAGFLALTLATWAISGANPFLIWWWNQKNHARFYVEFPRSYLAWLAINPIELAVAMGLPAAVWAVVGFARRRTSTAAWATLLVLGLLELSGKNLSEVARLWLPFVPGLLLAAGAGLGEEAGTSTVASTVALVGLETILLQSTIQVVYAAT
jgi:hypothetical protein